MLKEAQRLLTAKKPGYRITVFDCLRPLHVQQKMWDHVKDTPKKKYVASPDKGSMHNYGAAVDVSIVDTNGYLLDMGSEFDHFGERSHPSMEKTLLKQGKLSPAQVKNRQLLRWVMRHAGFHWIRKERWHFNAGSKEDIRRHYTVVE